MPSTNDQVLVFEDLEPIKIPVKIGDKEYVLKEANEAGACRFKNHFLKCARMENGQVVGMDGIADADSLLVSICLFEVIKDKNGNPTMERPVTQATIKNWNPRRVKILYEKCKEISDLSENEETVEFLTKRIEEDTKKLQKLQETNSRSTEEMISKNSLDFTPVSTE